MPRRRRWLKKVGRLADHVLDEIKEDIQSSNLVVLTSKAKQVAILSRETVEICDETATQRQKMVDLSAKIHSTLQQLSTGSDATHILETIRQLTSGDTLHEATELAKGLQQAARTCVTKSLEMVQLLDEGMDCLPGPLQKLLLGDEEEEEEGQDDDDDENNETPLMKDLNRDVQEVQTCIESIQHFNLTTAFTVGVQAFQQLAGKVARAQTLFDQLRRFATEISEMAHAMQSWNARQVVRESKDLVQCLRWTDEMQDTAAAAAKLMPVVIDLFQASADRVSVLWTALAHAKDCLLDCVEHVQQTKHLCLDAQQKCVKLVDQSLHIARQLERILKLSPSSVTVVRGLVGDGGEIEQALDLASHMDDIILECTKKVVAMVDRVQDAYTTMPPILTEDLDVTAAGTGRSDDPEPANIERDVLELDESRVALVDADLLTAAQAGVRAFAGVSQKSTVGTDLLKLVEQFSTDCQGTIESFLTVWDLPSAGKKITELCHLVNLGTGMKQFADQIKELLMAMMALMKAAITKFKKMDLGDIGETLGAVKDDLEDKMDDLKDKVQDKLQFWK